MFDFFVSFAADQLEADVANPVVDVLAPVDWSVDPDLFDSTPLNTVELP